MGEFLHVAFSYPMAVFTYPLIVVVGYWIVVVTGLFDTGDHDAPWLGLGGVPAGVTLSLLIAFSWLLTLIGSQITTLPVVPLLALASGWLGTRALLAPLRRLAPRERQPSRGDFVGQMCVIRTGSATADFGQAEVTAADGSSAVIQVRTTGQDRLSRGDSALIFEYDADGEFFWVMPYESEH
ncbi:YqiJ family protein [Nonomuraea ceibae]|uniref:YqiJ family protein n=1 Tax=Nonomuraea ceibae TaxID=1935170 RepID=UPI001C5F78F5|nr:YqiJ family protein [Nonomuraea ceibae]